MNCGDNVYESGSDDEYQRYFFPVYNADLAGPREGAPLLRSVNPAKWTHADDGHADYVVRMVTDRHSLSVFDVDGARLTLTQVDEAGHVIDRITVTKERRETSQA